VKKIDPRIAADIPPPLRKHKWDCDVKHPHCPKICCAAKCQACETRTRGNLGYMLHPTGIPIRVLESPIHGKGVFAGRDIHPGHLIGAYMGEVTYDLEHPKTLQLEDERGAVFGVYGTGPLQYLNHAEDPNAELDLVHVYAIDLIRKGDEITILYTENWDPEVDA
jgi:hypothetical protein